MLRSLYIFSFLLLFSYPALGQQISPKQAEKINWEEFISKEGRLSVLLPSKPTEQTFSINTVVGQIQMHLFASLGAEGATYTFSYWDVPKLGNTPEQISSALDAARDSHIKNLNGELLKEKPISIETNAGREVKAKNTSAIITSRIYIVKGRLYITSVWLPLAFAESELSKNNKIKFLDSLKLIQP